MTGGQLVSYSTLGLGCSRPAGLGYDPVIDALFVGGRDQNFIFGMDATNGGPICSFAAQDGGNNPQGVAMSPRGGVWHSSWNSSLLFELEGCKPTHPELRLGPNFPVAGGSVTLAVSRLAPGERGGIGYSLVGCGPVNTPFGQVLLSNPYTVLAIIPANGAGVASLSSNVPGALSGRTIYLHAGGLGGSGLSNNAIINP